MKTIRGIILLILLLHIQFLTYAQTSDYNVFFKNKTFSPTENKGLLTDSEFQNASCNGFLYGFIQFYYIPDKNQKEYLKSLGIELGDYIKRNAYSVVIPYQSYFQIQTVNFIRSIFIQSPDLKAGNIKNATNDERTELIITFYKNADLKQATTHLKNNIEGLIFTEKKLGTFTININQKQIQKLLAMPYIFWVEKKDMQAHPLDISSISLHRTNILKSTLSGERGLGGTGVSIGVFDGIIYNHIDFAGRLHVIKGSTVLDHSTEIAGLMAGAGNRNPSAIGHANDAEIYSWETSGTLLSDIDSGASTFNMVVANHSYFIGNASSCVSRGQYDIVSYYFDTLAAMHPSLLQTFAAGNHRANNCVSGGYRTVFEGLQSSKNGLTVGSVNATDGNSTDHSYGPTLDGRTKPDIVGRGVGIYSAATNNNYATASGTSFSTPNVAGTAALLYEHYRNLNSGTDPKSHTIKAILLNTATDLGNLGPDFIYGYGRIDGYKAAKVLESNLFLTDSIANQDSLVDTLVSISASSKTKQIKFLLAWAEEPTALPANEALINDLDLMIIDPNNDTIFPLVPDYTSPSSVASEKIDTLNNVEQVTINNVVVGDYKVVVLGTSIPNGKVGFSLTWLETEPYLELTYPFGGEKWLPPKDASTAQIIAWDGFDLSGTITIEYSGDSGSSWSTLASGLSNSVKYYTWNNASPNLYSSEVLIRVSTSGGMTSQNSRVFTIMSNPLNSGVSGIPCSGQITLYWDSTVSTDTFRIYQLIGKEMTPIAKTTDTFYTVTGLTNGTAYWFAISVIDNNGVESIRSWAQPFTPNGSTLPASVNTQPTDQKACRFSDITFTPSFNGTAPINYQWQVSTDGGVTWANLTGETSSNLTINNIDSNLMTNLYRNSFYNACGGIFYTDPVSIIADSIPQRPSISINPLNACKDTIEFDYPKKVYDLRYDWGFEDAENTTLSGLNLDNPTNQWVYPTLPGVKTVILKVSYPINNCSNADTTTVNIGCIALPIELLNFMATPYTDYILLEWQTANEFNNDYFDILKSTDLIDWRTIGTVDGTGNSYTFIQYNFKDPAPVMGIQYYKLSQFDLDGNISFSKTIQAVYDKNFIGINIFPNPVKDNLYLSSKQDISNVRIKDLTGKTVRVFSTVTSAISVSDLANGIYFIEIETESNTYRFKLLKQ
ncbi:MAG: S8 family serine peptidase [Bacteroidetes bacterium]|nr:S8 family serine peptidase [Bacteroidota bacterium]